MFERWTRSRRGASGRPAPIPPAGAGPDLSAVPPFPAELDGGLLAVDPTLISSYVGLAVTTVTPLDGTAAGPVDTHPTLGALVDDLEANHPGIKERLVEDSGELRRFVNVYVDDEDVRFTGGLGTELSDGAQVVILPAVAGG